MTTIELITTHNTQRQQVLSQMKSLYDQLVALDLAFWTKNMKQLFVQHPNLQTISWKQGFFYNDENHAFSLNSFTINGLELLEEGSYFRPRRWRYDKFDRNTISLLSVQEDKDVKENLRRFYDPEKQAQTTQILRVKHTHLLPAAETVAEWLVKVYGEFGERHFADTFGKKANIIFSREGLLIEDYDDGEAMDYGQLGDLFEDIN